MLPPNIYFRLREHLDWVRDQMHNWMTEDQAGRGLYADYLYNAITANWERKRPVWAMLMVNGLTASDIASRGFPVLDLYLAQLAEQQNKKVGAVERVEEQCLPLNGLTYGQVIFALNQTLQQQEDIRHGLWRHMEDVFRICVKVAAMTSSLEDQLFQQQVCSQY